MNRWMYTAALCLAAGLALAACGNGSKSPEPVAKPAKAAAKPAAPDAATAEAMMNKPMDGSSVEAFTRDLAALEGAVMPEQYEALQSALSYLRFYNFGGRATAELYQSLDGMTPNEIIASAGK